LGKKSSNDAIPQIPGSKSTGIRHFCQQLWIRRSIRHVVSIQGTFHICYKLWILTFWIPESIFWYIKSFLAFENIKAFFFRTVSILILKKLLKAPMKNYLSRPLLRLMYGEYWFRLSRLSMMVIGSFASYTKTKSVESAVWCLLTLDDDDVEQAVVNRYWCIAGNCQRRIKIPEQGQVQNCSFSFRTTIKQNSNGNEANNRTTNTEWIIMYKQQ
jgi:hypothetical protein